MPDVYRYGVVQGGGAASAALYVPAKRATSRAPPHHLARSAAPQTGPSQEDCQPQGTQWQPGGGGCDARSQRTLEADA